MIQFSEHEDRLMGDFKIDLGLTLSYVGDRQIKRLDSNKARADQPV
jgi:hypothetical protein